MVRCRWTGAVVLGALLLGAVAAVDPAVAQDKRPAPPTGGGIITPETTAGPTATADSGAGVEVVRTRTARVVPGALDPLCGVGAGREVVFPLFDDVTVQAVEEGRTRSDGRVVWSGTVDGAVGQDVIVTLEGGCDVPSGNEHLSAHFMLGGDVYAIEPAAPGEVTVSQLTPMAEEDEPTLSPPPAGPPPARQAAGAPAA
ncbi:hypothetical protein P8605_38270, partial [Streptomyces sp. T-3]|nr:hypothetical protein [Streptomyces sp. T-3]